MQDGGHLVPDLIGGKGHEGWPLSGVLKPSAEKLRKGVAREAGQGEAPTLGEPLQGPKLCNRSHWLEGWGGGAAATGRHRVLLTLRKPTS